MPKKPITVPITRCPSSQARPPWACHQLVNHSQKRQDQPGFVSPARVVVTMAPTAIMNNNKPVHAIAKRCAQR